MDTHSILSRLDQLTNLLIDAYPDGLTTPEIADQLGITRQTALKDIGRLEENGEMIYQPMSNTYAIDPRSRITPLPLTLAQAWMLYLPLRRTVRAQMHRYPLVQHLLQRLAFALEPQLGGALIESAPNDIEADDVLKILFRAWRERCLLEIRYQPLNKSESRRVIAPYWFEPAVWSDSAYVIAGIQRYDGDFSLATLKLERITAAVPRSEQFEPVESQLLLDHLQQSWGIWVGDEPVTVRLRFHNRVRQRLLETRWHPTEVITDEGDGSVLWQAQIAEPQEMLPWIRGWGPDVEILEPQSIRDQVAIDADRTARIYGMCEDLGDEYF